MFVLKLIVFLLPVLWGASCVDTYQTVVVNVGQKEINEVVLAAVQHTDRLIASGYGRPWIPTTPEESQRTPIKLQIQKFEEDVNASRVLQKNDREQMVNWADEFQIKRLDVTMRYRMQMIRHQEHSLKSNGNPKWLECLFVHRKEIRRSIHLYYESEHLCLKAATSKDEESKESAEQLDKQIVKWRKGYRYLVHLCRDEHPTSKQQEQECLVEYMQNDKYNEVIRRLMSLKQSATSDLYAYYNSSLIDLEECLKTNLSRYLDRIRNIMATLNKCYTITT